MGSPVVHFEIHGKDRDSLSKFYEDLFGWNLQPNPEWNYVIVDTFAGGGINGGFATNEKGPQVVFYVKVPDLEKALDQIESLGGKTVMPPDEVPNVVRLAQFTDPQGNLIGLVQDVGPEGPGVSEGSNAPIDWFEVLGTNAKELYEFYAKAFGWQINPSDAGGFEYAEVDTGAGQGISGGIGASPTGKGAVTVYAKVDDLDKYLLRANELGAKTVLEPMKVGEHTTVAAIIDPQGNAFGLFQIG